MKRLLLAALLCAPISAETVYLTANGKTYHRSQTCMSLKRAKQVYQAERSAAEQHGRKTCGICYREKAAKKATAPAWAAVVK